MRFRYLGAYRKDHSNGLNPDSIFVEDGDVLKEYEAIPEGIPFIYKNHTLRFLDSSISLRQECRNIFITDKYAFVAYQTQLNIFHHDGELFQSFNADSIRFFSGLFLLSGSSTFILKDDAETVFTRPRKNPVGLASNGTVLFVNEAGFLGLGTMCEERVFDAHGSAVFELDELSLYEGPVEITGVIETATVEHDIFTGTDSRPEKSLFYVILTNSALFVISQNVTVKKSLSRPLKYIDTKNSTVHDLVYTSSYGELFVLMALVLRVRIVSETHLENILFRMVMARRDISAAMDVFRHCASLSQLGSGIGWDRVVCRLYRRVDDIGKQELECYIDTLGLSIDNLYYIIIYKPECIKHFISRCITDRRLFYLVEIAAFYKKTGRHKEIKRELLKQGVLIVPYTGLEVISEAERREIVAEMAHYDAENLPDYSGCVESCHMKQV